MTDTLRPPLSFLSRTGMGFRCSAETKIDVPLTGGPQQPIMDKLWVGKRSDE